MVALKQIKTLPQHTIDALKREGGLGAERPPKFRFAPSPTGDLHIGGARTAIFNYLGARKLGGKFVLRIEDTDQKRNDKQATEGILNSLRWLGIQWDEEPLYQSDRGVVYNQKIDLLLFQKKAYVGDEGAVFFRMPEPGTVVVVNDHVRGKVPVTISRRSGTGDYVIRRSNGTPSFLFANVVDDGETGITHVIRGDDHLINAARQIPLIQALGYPIPEWFHVSLIHDDQGKKLSKRKKAASVMEYPKTGHDPLPLVNHLARLGSGIDDPRTMKIAELAKAFDLDRFVSAPARIGVQAIEERNKTYLASLEPAAMLADFEARAPKLAKQMDSNQRAALIDACQGRVATYDEVVKQAEFLFDGPTYSQQDAEQYARPELREHLANLGNALRELEVFSLKSVRDAFETFNRESGLDFANYQASIRWALTGITLGLPVDATIAVLGKKQALQRLADSGLIR